jgi:hypothetical protein
MRYSLMLYVQFVKVVIIIDSFGPLSGYMIVIGNSNVRRFFVMYHRRASLQETLFAHLFLASARQIRQHCPSLR